MRVIHTVNEMIEQREEWQKANLKIGLVPTMGYLHAGHLALVRQARLENDLVVVSIFVNPLQFGAREDLSRYPRDLPKDLALLREEKVDLVFNPGPEEIYPPGFDSGVEVGTVTLPLEGAVRPGHFRGVTTVVAKLFNLTGPTRTYFGQKDVQQTVVIKKMVQDLNFPVKVMVVPTRREADGLAMSSRNVYLSPQERKAAGVLFKALKQAEKLWNRDPRPTGLQLRRAMNDIIAGEALANPDYTSASNPLTLQEFEGEIPANQEVLLSLAVRFGKTRLIDNILLPPRES